MVNYKSTKTSQFFLWAAALLHCIFPFHHSLTPLNSQFDSVQLVWYSSMYTNVEYYTYLFWVDVSFLLFYFLCPYSTFLIALLLRSTKLEHNSNWFVVLRFLLRSSLHFIHICVSISYIGEYWVVCMRSPMVNAITKFTFFSRVNVITIHAPPVQKKTLRWDAYKALSSLHTFCFSSAVVVFFS